MTILKIDGATAKNMAIALKDCIDSTSCRTQLQGVRIEYAGTDPLVGASMIAIATDGAKLGKFDFVLDGSQDIAEMETFKPFLLPAAVLDTFVKVKSFDIVTLDILPTELKVSIGGTTSVFTLDNTAFPDWRSVFPTVPVEMTIGFDAKQLEFIGKAIKKLGDKTIQSCAFNIIDKQSSVVINTPHKHLTYLLMPTNVKK